MATVSLIMPTYSLNEELAEMAEFGALTYRPQVDQLIIMEDGGIYSKDLAEIADIYIYSKKNEGFTINVNRGWKLATGDYTIIANSDTQLFSGNLKDLCIPGKVTCPLMSGYNVVRMCGAFFCVPATVKEKYGMLREELIMFASDTEFEQRTWDLFETVKTVDVYHKGGVTREVAGVNTDEIVQRDREAYDKILPVAKRRSP